MCTWQDILEAFLVAEFKPEKVHVEQTEQEPSFTPKITRRLCHHSAFSASSPHWLFPNIQTWW